MKKFLIILSFLLLPFSAMAANTNAFDTIKVNLSIVDNGNMKVFGNQTNFGSLVVTQALNTANRELLGQGNATVVRWGTGFLDMLDSGGVTSVAWGARKLDDALGNPSVEWDARDLRNAANVQSLDWQIDELYTRNGGAKVYNWTNFTFFTSHTFNSNATVIGSLAVTNTGSFSNVVVQTIDGVSYFNSGTNNLMRIIVNSSAGTLQTEGMFTQATNTLNAAVTPAVNTIYTNNGVRLMVTTGVNLPTGIATVSAVALWSVSGTTTNFTAPVSSSAGVNGAVTNFTMGLVQPSALYMITNINVGAGAPTLIVPTYRETRF